MHSGRGGQFARPRPPSSSGSMPMIGGAIRTRPASRPCGEPQPAALSPSRRASSTVEAGARRAARARRRGSRAGSRRRRRSVSMLGDHRLGIARGLAGLGGDGVERRLQLGLVESGVVVGVDPVEGLGLDVATAQAPGPPPMELSRDMETPSRTLMSVPPTRGRRRPAHPDEGRRRRCCRFVTCPEFRSSSRDRLARLDGGRPGRSRRTSGQAASLGPR